MGQINIGVNNVARKVTNAYVGIDGKARKVKAVYVGDANGKARLVWQSVVAKLVKFISSIYKGYCSYTHQYISYDSNFNRSISNLQKAGDNLYAATFSESCYTNGEYRATGIQFVKVDSNGKPIEQRTSTFYSNSGSNIAPYGSSITSFTPFGNGKTFTLGLSYISYTEYSTYTYYMQLYDYITNTYYQTNIGSGQSTSYESSYPSVVPAGDNGVMYITEHRYNSSNTKSFSLGFLYNVTFSYNSYSCEQGTSINLSTTYSKSTNNSSMSMFAIDNVSGFIVESEYYTGNKRFIKYKINTGSGVTGINRLTLTELGTYSNLTSYSYYKQIKDNKFLAYSYDGKFAIITINDSSVSVNATATISELTSTYYMQQIGTSNTFVITFSHSKEKLLYVDITNNTITYLGEVSVETKDHTRSDYGLYTACPYGNDSLIYFEFTKDQSYGYVHSVIDTYK